jgi:hypothetical protein
VDIETFCIFLEIFRKRPAQDKLGHSSAICPITWTIFCQKLMKMVKAIERKGEAAIFTGARDSKGARESQIYLILSHVSLS